MSDIPPPSPPGENPEPVPPATPQMPPIPPASSVPPPVGGPGQMPPGQYPPAVTPQTVYIQPEKKSRTGCWIAALVLLALVFGGCATLVVLAGTFAETIEDNINEFQESRLEDERAVEDAVRLSNCGLDDAGNLGRVEVDFTSPLDVERGWIGLEINFIDDDDVVVGSTTVVFENLSPGQSARGEGIAFDLADGASVAQCELVDVTVL